MPRPAPRVPVVLLGLALGGALGGLLMFRVGESLDRELPVEPPVMIECSGFPAEGERRSVSEIRLATPPEHGVALDMHFLDVDRAVLRTRKASLIAGAQMSFAVPTREMHSALQVLASDPVTVQVTLLYYDPYGGPPERRAIPCTRVR